MYNNYYPNTYLPNYQTYPYQTDMVPQSNMVPQDKQGDNDERFFPFLAPLLLGGLAGAAIARPWGYGGYPYPYPVPYPYPYYPRYY